MLSEKYKCIFVHIPKAAGQSIEHFFLKHHDLSWVNREPLLLRHNGDPTKGPERLAHLTAGEYTQFGYVSPADLASYFKFSFVRNPWARIVSEYNYRHYHRRMPFKTFLRKGIPVNSDFSDAYRHFLPQYDFLYDDAGHRLVDFVGRFEQLQQDFDVICDQLGFTETTLPHVNSAKKSPLLALARRFKRNQSSKRQRYTEYYDDEAKKLVERMYAQDIETFRYRFGE